MTVSETTLHAADLPPKWRSDARFFRDHDQTSVAVAYERCVDALEEGLRQEGETALTLAEAAEESGYSVDHLSRLLREGKIQNAGRRGAPRIAARDLPRRSGLEPRPRRAHLSRAQIVRSAIKKGA